MGAESCSQRSGRVQAELPVFYSQASDGTGAPDPLIRGGVLQFPLSFSPDGKYLLTRGMGVPSWNLNLLSMSNTPCLAAGFRSSSSKRRQKSPRTADGSPTRPGTLHGEMLSAPVLECGERPPADLN